MPLNLVTPHLVAPCIRAKTVGQQFPHGVSERMAAMAFAVLLMTTQPSSDLMPLRPKTACAMVAVISTSDA
jgi:hypothetical protein